MVIIVIIVIISTIIITSLAAMPPGAWAWIGDCVCGKPIERAAN